MQPLQFVVPVDTLEALADILPFVILALVVVNLGTRLLAQRSYRRQAAEDDDDSISRFIPHEILNVLLMLASLAFMIVEPHGGMVLSVLVLGMFLADFFEFEARKVEVRNEMPLEPPKSALVASVFVLLYAAFQSLFFLVAPFWNAVI
ncbi:MAG: DUF7313 family protein [Halobacteriota archaeon]